VRARVYLVPDLGVSPDVLAAMEAPIACTFSLQQSAATLSLRGLSGEDPS
jgi:hypothetical protein